MTTDDMAGFTAGGSGSGEPITIPPMHDAGLRDRWPAARLDNNSARTGIPHRATQKYQQP